MVQVYQPNETDFTVNGDVLFPIECTDDVELNGVWTRILSHPIDEEGRWKHIVNNAVIKAPSHNGEQLYRITNVEKNDSGVSAEANPIFWDCADSCFLLDKRIVSKNGQQALNLILANSGFTGRSNITSINTSYYVRQNALAAIQGTDNSFLTRWGGEVIYNNKQIVINQTAGSDNGVELLYGKNIPTDGMTETVDTSSVVTRIVPVGYNGRGLSTANPWVDSPLINSYPVVKTRVVNFDYVALRADLDPSTDTEGMIVCASVSQFNTVLRQESNKLYNAGLDKPTVSIECDMVLLGNTAEYEKFKDLEKVSLGDTIHCRHNKLDIVTDARIVALEYDCCRDMVSRVTIGAVPQNFLNDVSQAISVSSNAISSNGTVKASQVQGTLNAVDFTNANIMNSTVMGGRIYSANVVDVFIQESQIEGCLAEEILFRGEQEIYDGETKSGSITPYMSELQIKGEGGVSIYVGESEVLAVDGSGLRVRGSTGYTGTIKGLRIVNGIIIGEA